MWTPSVVYLLTRFWSSRRSRERKHVLDSKTVLLFFHLCSMSYFNFVGVLQTTTSRLLRLLPIFSCCFTRTVSRDWRRKRIESQPVYFPPFIFAVKSQPFNTCAIVGERQRMQLLFLEIQVVYSSAFFVKKEMTSFLDFLSASRALLSTRVPSSSLNLHKYWKAMVVYLWWSHCECLCFLYFWSVTDSRLECSSAWQTIDRKKRGMTLFVLEWLQSSMIKHEKKRETNQEKILRLRSMKKKFGRCTHSCVSVCSSLFPHVLHCWLCDSFRHGSDCGVMSWPTIIFFAI